MFETLCRYECNVPVSPCLVLMRKLNRLESKRGANNEKGKRLFAILTLLAQVMVKLALHVILQVDGAFDRLAIPQDRLLIVQGKSAIRPVFLPGTVTGH